MLPLGACAGAPKPEIVTRVECPVLPPPPGKVVDALEAVGRKDPSSAAWVIDLDKHYAKLGACR
jgi:hypothetical protein